MTLDFKDELELALMGQAALVLYCNELWFDALGSAQRWGDTTAYVRRHVLPHCTHQGAGGLPFFDNNGYCIACRAHKEIM